MLVHVWLDGVMHASLTSCLPVDCKSAELESATLRISGSKFVENAGTGDATQSNGGAAALYGPGLRCSIETSVFENNRADRWGGAINAWGIMTLRLSRCTLAGNLCGGVGLMPAFEVCQL